MDARRRDDAGRVRREEGVGRAAVGRRGARRRARLVRAALIALVAASAIACGRRKPEIVGDFVGGSIAPIASSATGPLVAPSTTNEDLGTDEGVVRAWEAAMHVHCTTAKGCVCIRRGKAFPDLVVLGSVRADASCRLEGFFFRRVWYEPIGAATRTVLLEMGWDGADRSKRVDLAMSWTREVMLAFEGVVDEKPSAFLLPTAPPFHPLEATWEPTGAIEVRAFVGEPASPLGTVGYHQETLRFDSAARVVKVSVGTFFSAPVK